MICVGLFLFLFYTDTPVAVIYTLSLHDALPISRGHFRRAHDIECRGCHRPFCTEAAQARSQRIALAEPFLSRFQISLVCGRSEEHTSELQSRENLVCRLLLEKKKRE